MRSSPHLSIKGGAGLSEDPACLDPLSEIVSDTAPFEVRLGNLAVFPDDERVLYLEVESPGWMRLHRTLVDTIAQRTGAQMHPLEEAGWIPHVTLLRLTAEALEQREEILAAAIRTGVPVNTAYTARILRMECLHHRADRWKPVHTFGLTGPR
ncbi:hypothetical protein GCM10023085_63280 [Actinomadura viridis]|uniref:2'-5' RNA ligase n=2 Tax=Actinomadura viridis TaxID=58110 RepID=A0A931DD21_9ACTN|nr:2'-5' RNA ligase [Actinomadura viridis]